MNAPTPPESLARVLFSSTLAGFLALAAILTTAQPLHATERTVLLIAGPASHAVREHEYNAGVLLLQKSLQSVANLRTRVALNGWPADPALLEGVDAVVIYADGGAKHPAILEGHLAELGKLMARGVGLGLIHYTVEPAETGAGRDEFLEWAGGYFEVNWSVNPTWTADIKVTADHPVTRGIKPFTLDDEWYYHLRFPAGGKGVTPLLLAMPNAKTLARRDGPHEGNPAVRAAVARSTPQTLAWAFERLEGGRGFGFTGGHYLRNWLHDDFRKLVLNGFVWLAKAEVPTDGVVSTVTINNMDANLDAKTTLPHDFNPQDLAGTWIALPGDLGAGSNLLTFKRQGKIWAGTMTTDFGEMELKDIVVEGPRIAFTQHFDPKITPHAPPPTRVEASLMAGELKLVGMRGRIARKASAAQLATFNASKRPTPSFPALPDNGLARTPPMDWNSWNYFNLSIDDKTVREIADTLVSTGLRDAGYVYVVVDEGWQGQRDEQGVLQPNTKFPDMKALGEYLHERGLKFGIWSTPGPYACAGHVGGYAMRHRTRGCLPSGAWIT